MNTLSAQHNRMLLGAVGLASMLVIGACESTPPPTASLTAARAAISNAEKAEAGRYAAPELSEARDRMAAADSAAEKKSMIESQRLAEQARVEADLAYAMTGEAKANAVNDEMKQGNKALGEELQRKAGE